MKLLFLTEHYPPTIGGVASSARRISHTAARLGHDVHIVVPARELPAGMAQCETPDENLTVHRFGQSKNLDFTLQQALNYLQWLHGQQEFDAVWGHYVAGAGFLATWFGQRAGRPTVLSVRGNDLDRQLFPPGDFSRLHWCLQTCDRIVAVSRDLAEKIRTLVGRDATVLPNTVDTSLFQPGEKPRQLMERHDIQPEELILGFSGELRAKKGLRFLITAFQEILARQPVRLVLIGEVRPKERGEYERAVAVGPEAKQLIIQTGHLEDAAEVVQYLQMIDVFLLPSVWDGMPNSLLEAMAVGVPVIASDAGAIPEVVTDGVTGFLVPRTHLHLLSQRVDELMAMSGAARNRLIQAARAHVCEHHGAGVERQRLSDVLDGLCNSDS